MEDEKKAKQAQEQKPAETAQDTPDSFIVVAFSAEGMANFKVSMQKVSPGQLFAAANYLQWMANNEMTRITNAAPKILTP